MLVLFRVFGFLYLCSGIWCAFQVELASNFLGFQLTQTKGFAEFFSVYGGLQVGLGLAMILSSMQTRYLEASVYFSAIFSTSLLLFRLLSFAVYGVIEDFYSMLILEFFIAIGLWWAWLRFKKTSAA